ncbi:MAG: hypothetical protein ACOH17_09355 [Cellulomonas sp.]
MTAPERGPGARGLAAGLRHATRAQRIELELDRTVPGWVLRAALGVVGGLLVALSDAAALPTGAVLVGLIAAACVAAAWPGSLAAGALVVGVVVVEVSHRPGFTVGTFVLILLVHLLLRLSAVAAQAGWRARVEVAVLTAQAREVAVVQVGVQVLALVAASVSLVAAGVDDAALGAWVRVGAVGGVLALGVLLAPRAWVRLRG